MKSLFYTALVGKFIEQNKGSVAREAKKRVIDNAIDIRDFSLIDHPEETLKSLMRVIWAHENLISFKVNFLDQYCLDVGPYILFALLKQELGNKKFNGGRMHDRVTKVLSAMNIDRFAKMLLPSTDTDDVWPMKMNFEIQPDYGEKLPGLTEHRHEKVALKITNEFDRWLWQCDLMFSEEGKGRFLTLVSEILDNARHATPKKQSHRNWAVAGFMAKRNRNAPGKEEYWCHLAFVTVGRSIAETLQQSEGTETRNYLDNYYNTQKEIQANIDHDLLATLCSLQDTVTCDATEDEVGGSGMATIISYMSQLSGDYSQGKAAHAALLSGKSCILLHPPYNEVIGAHGRQQWFNEKNQPTISPDRAFVRTMPVAMPGTIFTLRFVIDSKFLTKQAQE